MILLTRGQSSRWERLILVLGFFFLIIFSLQLQVHAGVVIPDNSFALTNIDKTRFINPSCMDRDSAGNFYVTDTFASLVYKLSPTGTYISSFTVNSVDCVAVNGDDELIITRGGDIIYKYSTTGTLISSFTGVLDGFNGSFAGVTIDGAGNIIAVKRTGMSSTQSRVERYDPDGNPIDQFGTADLGNAAGNVAVDSNGNVFVCNINSKNVKKFDVDGNFVTTISGWGAGSLGGCNDVKVDADDNVYVAFGANNDLEDSVNKFDNDGTPIGSPWGTFGSAEGEFVRLGPIYVDSVNGFTYAADKGMLQKFEIDGTFDSKLFGFRVNDNQQLSNAEGLVMRGDRLYVTESGNDRVQIFNTDGDYLGKWGQLGSGDSDFTDPQGIAKDTDGNIYVADANNQRIQKFDVDGNYLDQWATSVLNTDDELSGPIGITMNSQNILYVTYFDSPTINLFDTSGGAQGSFSGTGSNLAVDLNDYLYQIDFGTSAVVKYDSDGDIVDGWGTAGSDPGELLDPGYIFVDLNYRTYIIDENGIEIFDTSGNFATRYTALRRPMAITFHQASNTTYVIDELNRIVKFQLKNQVANLDTGLDVIETATNHSIKTGSAYGVDPSTATIRLQKSGVAIAEMPANLIVDIDWDNVTADVNQGTKKSFVHNLYNAPGVTAPHILYVPRGSDDESMRICPEATSLAQVSFSCTNGVNFTDGATHSVTFPNSGSLSVTVTAVTVGGQKYWRATNVGGSGGESDSPILGLPPRGVSGDGWADIILGKRDFSEVGYDTTVGGRLYLPHGVLVDTVNDRMYVYDSGNSRVLGFTLSTCLALGGDPLNCTPEIVLGQPDFVSRACNGDSGFQNFPDKTPASASTMCTLPQDILSPSEAPHGSSMALDADGNLYITDNVNNRVLKYNDPFTTDGVADQVWGQDDFSGIECNKGNGTPDNSSICFSWGNSNNWTAGVDIDDDGNLWVVDSGNNRVLKFPMGEGVIASTADLVLGQVDFATATSGSGLDKFHDPAAVRVVADGTVYVADRYNSRVLRFASPTTGSTGEVFGSGFDGPAGIDFDPTEPGRLWIDNVGHTTVELWDETSETKIRTIGTDGDGNILGNGTGGVGVDEDGNVYVAVSHGLSANSILKFNKAGPDGTYSNRLFPPTNGNYMDQYGMGTGDGVAVVGNQVIVADQGRLLFWNTPGGVSDLVNGKAADGYVGAPSFFTYNDACCHLLKADESGHLYTTVGTNGDSLYHIDVYDLPLTSGESPSHRIEFPIDALGGGQMDKIGPFEGFSGILPADDASYLWVSHAVGHRVFRIRDPLTAPVIDVVLGQTDLTSVSANQGGAMTNTSLNNPWHLSFDTLGNFYLSDYGLENAGNYRLLIYYPGTIPTDNGSIIYTVEPDKIITDVAPFEPAFDSENHMVVGFNPYYNIGPNPDGGWFPGIYNDPLTSDRNPDSYLNDYYSMAYGMAFDAENNLYVTDHNRARLMIYLNPLSGLAPTPTPTATPTFTPTATSTPSPTPTPTLTPAPAPCYAFKWGGLGSGNGQFNWAENLVINSTGKIYVVDQVNNRIQKFDSDGNYIGEWGSAGTADGLFNSPNGIAVDSGDNIYVTEASGYRVQKFDQNGNFILKWGTQGNGNSEFDAPLAIAVDSNGDVYVTESNNDRIQKFDSDGNYLDQWGTTGTGDGEFNTPYGIAIDSTDQVFVVDKLNRRVQVFDTDGNFLNKWGSNGTGYGQFGNPTGITVDDAGNIYVTEQSGRRVQKFENDGGFITVFGTSGSGNGQFNFPDGVAVSGAGAVYVADSGNNRVQVFTDGACIPPTSTPTATPSPTSTSTPGPTSSITASPTPTAVPEDCSLDATTETCQLAVIINGLRVSRIDATNVMVCWDTNIETKGNITYENTNGQGNTVSESDYLTGDHCLTLSNIPTTGDYDYQITSTSYAGNSDTVIGLIDGETVPSLPETGSENPQTEDQASSIGEQIAQIPSRIATFTAEVLTNSVSFLNASTQSAPAFALPLSGAVAIAAGFSYPQLFSYGLLWFKRGKKQNPWGIVYDSDRKPLAFATVRAVLPAVAGTTVQTIVKEVITDTQGKYALTLPKGDYILQGIYNNLPTKEMPLRVATDGEYIGVDIQLDKDLQAAFLSKARKLVAENLGRLSWVLSIIGFLYTIYAVILNPTVVNFVLIGFYLVQAALLILFSIKHTWGKVYDSATGKPITGAFVRVYDVKEGRQVNVIMTDPSGRYGFIQNEGDYFIRVDVPGYNFPSKDARASDYQKLPSGIDVLKVHLQKNQLISLNLPLDKA